jgi:hypothetical protein
MRISPFKFERPDLLLLSHPRSGTHFLAASLESHPKLHSRGECFLGLKCPASETEKINENIKKFIFVNKPDKINIAIVMYRDVNILENLCGPLADFRVIHLLRSPDCVARSIVQAKANKKLYGKKHKMHYKINEEVPPNNFVEFDNLEEIKAKIKKCQKEFCKRLKSHTNVLTVSYEELTGNRQVNQIPEDFARRLLTFLNLEYYPLSNQLRKTS